MGCKGVVLIAAGHPYYGQWALNLCLSIKYNDMFLPVSIAWKDNALNHIKNNLNHFDKVIELTDKQTTRNGVKDYTKAKLHLYELSPYDETIFIDADVILLKNKSISELFEKLKDVDFTIGCRAEDNLETTNELQWTSPSEVIEHYGSGTLYHISSEFIHFKKTAETKKLFKTAQKIHTEPNIEYKRFNGTVADELAFQLAMKLLDMKPHQVPFLPFYWEHYEKKTATISHIPSEFYGYSMGGCMNREESIKIYNGLANFYSQQYHTPVFLARHKRNFEAMRQNI
jgi:hypothetical protein